MNFNKHYDLEGLHAFLSASKYHWINYDINKLESTFTKHMAARMGTRIHEFASEAIELGIKLPKTKKTLNLYINDAIGYKMTPEQVLFYSENCFGTADAISFKNNMLRIHDLKTGDSPTSMKQLEIYTALFCLEYNKDPESIDVELRIYQTDNVVVHNPAVEDIRYIMDKIVAFDNQIDKLKIKMEV